MPTGGFCRRGDLSTKGVGQTPGVCLREDVGIRKAGGTHHTTMLSCSSIVLYISTHLQNAAYKVTNEFYCSTYYVVSMNVNHSTAGNPLFWENFLLPECLLDIIV